MQIHKIEFPWDLKEDNATLFVRSVLIAHKINTPSTVKVTMPSKEYIIYIEK
ncbi:hypothetical protein GCM10008915_64310 [Bifidobacterium pullorum subsp. gallinarum]